MLINKESLRRNRFVQSLIKFANNNIVAKATVALFVWLVVLIPTWLYLGVRLLVEPVGFWQELAVLTIFAVVIGWAQFLLFLGGVIFTVSLIFENL